MLCGVDLLLTAPLVRLGLPVPIINLATIYRNVLDLNEKGMLVGTIKKITGPSYSDYEEHAFVMEVKAVPVPAAVWLLGSGRVGLLGVGRKNS